MHRHIPWRTLLRRIIGRTKRNDRIWYIVHDYGIEIL